jgi:hypothetical protein
VTSPAGQITIRGTYLPAAINPGQWQNWSSPPFPWPDARFYEYQNTGPGSVAAADVPQLTAAQAATYTVGAYLGNWRPRLAGPPAAPAGIDRLYSAPRMSETGELTRT